jgi:hypothetical protein
MQSDLRVQLNEFEGRLEEILTVTSNPDLFKQYTKKFLDFFEHYNTLCVKLMKDEQNESALMILTKLHALAMEILSKIPSELDPLGKLKTFFSTPFKDTVKRIKFDLDAIKRFFKPFASINDITKQKKSPNMHFYIILEVFLQTTNNLAVIYYKSAKPEKSFFTLLAGIHVLSCVLSASHYLKFHGSSMALNLVCLLKENNLVEANQLLATSILHLESLELEIEKQSNLGIIYTFINEKIGNFAELMT